MFSAITALGVRAPVSTFVKFCLGTLTDALRMAYGSFGRTEPRKKNNSLAMPHIGFEYLDLPPQLMFHFCFSCVQLPSVLVWYLCLRLLPVILYTLCRSASSQKRAYGTLRKA